MGNLILLTADYRLTHEALIQAVMKTSDSSEKRWETGFPMKRKTVKGRTRSVSPAPPSGG
jgi:hypothetical protein